MIGRILNKLKRVFKKPRVETPSGWFGNYPSWQQASAECGGYDDKAILARVGASVLKVKNGEAVYERDSVLFDEVQISQPLLKSFQSSVENDALHVVDFGGSLGSSYFQHKALLKEIPTLKWAVVEQEHFVDFGKQKIEGGHLKFFYSIDEALGYCRPQVLFVSSVIQYFEKPYELISMLLSHRFQYIIIDRTAFLKSPAERITRQVVPPGIYKASYPAWFLNEEKFVKAFAGDYDLIDSFPSAFDPEDTLEDGVAVYRKGFYFKLK
jgi:putative methyltransferase (TIGR04325 family)